MISLIVAWWFAIQLLGITCLPICASIFRDLPLKGFSLSKTFGIMIVGLISWLLSMLGLARFTQAGILITMFAILLLGMWALGEDGLKQLLLTIMSNWRHILAYELFFMIAFLAGIVLRLNSAYGPAISSTEKLMDLAFVSGILQSQSFPPQDPWLAGYGINYYYLGYLFIAMLAKLTNVSASEAFNLGLATVFALAILTASATIHMLIHSVRKRYKSTRDKIGLVTAMLLGAFLLTVVGNQAGAIQFVAGTPESVVLDPHHIISIAYARLRGDTQFAIDPPILTSDHDFGEVSEIDFSESSQFNWWWPSRAVWDDIETSPGVALRRYNITEFPFFSFYLGDLHPHVIAIPFGLLMLAISAYEIISVGYSTSVNYAHNKIRFLVIGALIGSLYAINSWDAPTYALIYVLALLIAHRFRYQNRPFVYSIKASLRPLTLVGLAAFGSLLPFLVTFDSFAGGASVPLPFADIPVLKTLGKVVAPVLSHTSIYEFLVMFGPFAIILVAFVFAQSTRLTDPTSEDLVEIHKRRSILALWAITVGTLILGQVIKFPLLCLLPFAILCLFLAFHARTQPSNSLVLLGTAAGAVAILVADVFYLRDPFENRMNTVFKFYYQTWILWSVLAAYAVWDLLERVRKGVQFTLLWSIPSTVLVAAGLVYPFATLKDRAPWSFVDSTLDGIAYIEQVSPDQYAAIQWIIENTMSQDIVMTAPGRSYDYSTSLVSAVTGRPTLLGWSGSHERLWRRNSPDVMAQINAREQDVPRIYTTTGVEETNELLRRYHVDYIYISSTERQRFESRGFNKFDVLFERVFSQGNVSIYRVVY